MSLYAFTSITFNYLPKATVLAKSLKRYNPEIKFLLLVAEEFSPEMEPYLACFDEVCYISELPVERLPSWIFKHLVVEICTAVKGVFLDLLCARKDCDAVMYFDPDIAIFAPLTPVLEELERSSIVLTPHQTEPEETLDAIRDNEMCSLKYGVYNLGFLAVRNDGVGRSFARWWRSRLEQFCYADFSEGLFTDQKWVDLAPALFPGVGVLRHPELNVATWNLTSRHVTGSFANGFLVNSRPLVFYHYSGFDSGAQVTMLLKYGKHMKALFDLRNWYIQRCAEEGQMSLGQRPWQYSVYSDGRLIPKEHRLLYRSRPDLQEMFPDPFDNFNPSESFYHWYEANAAR